MATIAKLVVEMSANTQGLRRSLDQAQGRVQKFAQSVRRRASQIGKWLAGAFTVAAGAVALFVKQGLASIDAQAKMARQIGASVDGLRALTEAGEDAGVSTQALQQSVDRFNARLGEARRGTGQAKEALDRLGLSADALSRMDVDDRMATIADRMQELGYDTQEAADVLRQFGIRNREMINLLIDGGGAIRDMRGELEQLGLGLSRIDTQKVEDANDAMRRIGLIADSVKQRLTVALAPALETAANMITEMAKESGGFRTAIEDAMAGAMEKTAGFLRMIDEVVVGLQKVQRFQLQAEAFGATVNNIATGSDELPEVFNRLQQLEQDIARRERRIADGSTIAGRGANFLETQASNIRETPAQKILDQTALNMARIIGHEANIRQDALLKAERDSEKASQVADVAIKSAIQVADSQRAAVEATKDATTSVRDFSDAAVTAALSIRDAASNDPRYSLTPDEGTASSRARARFEASANRVGSPQTMNLGGNPSARPTWSTEGLPSIGEAPKFGFSSVAAKSASEVRGGGKNLGTLKLQSDKGSIDVEADSDKLASWLANTLSGVAAGA